MYNNIWLDRELYCTEDEVGTFFWKITLFIFMLHILQRT